MIQSILFFTVFYPVLDIHGSVQKQKKLLASGQPVIAYRTFNDAFTFYYEHPIVTLPSAASVSDYLREHPSALVLERAREPHLQDSLLELSVLTMDKDLFSRQYSIIYKRTNQ
jgi:hypothetical protein